MRLIVVDSDESYLKQLQLVVSKSQEIKVEIITAKSLDQLLPLSNSIIKKSVLLIYEELIFESLNILDELEDKFIKPDIFVLSDGVVEDEFLSYLYEHPLISKNPDHIFISKYQQINQMLKEIKDKYLRESSKERVLNSCQSKLITVYSPIKKNGDSKSLETTISKLNKCENKLIIHMDPYYGLENSDQENPFNLSFLFTMIKRKKKNLSFLVDEIGQQIAENCHLVSGPMNMLDIDCLNEGEEELWFKWLRERTQYDRIYINICGVHVTEFISRILLASDERVLISDQVKVIDRVKSQFDYKWTVAKEYGLLRD